MNRIVFLVLLALAFVIEAQLRIVNLPLDLAVLFAYFAGLRLGPSQGILYGSGIGLLSDVFAGNILGPNIMGKCAAGYLSSFLKEGWLLTWTPVLGLIGVFFLTALDGFIAYVAMSIFSEPPTAASDAAMVVLWQAGVNSIFGVFLRPRYED